MVPKLSHCFKQFISVVLLITNNVLPSSSYERDYIFINATLPYDDSNALCSFLYGTSLASIHNDDQNAAAIAQCTWYNVSCWIGANLYQDDTWLWTDGTAFDYGYNTSGGIGPWLENEPNNMHNEECVLIRSSGSRGWNDAKCSKEIALLCNYPLYTTIINDTIHNIRVPIHNHYIGTIDILDEVRVEFDFIIHSQNTYKYSNLLHIGSSLYLLSVDFYRFTDELRLYVLFLRINSTDYLSYYHIMLDTLYHFDFAATQTSVIALLDDTIIYNESELLSHGIYMNQRIYISNQYYSPTNASLRNLKITTNNAQVNPFNYLCDYHNRFSVISGNWSFDPSNCWLTQSNIEGGTVWLGDKDAASIEWTDYKIEFVVQLIQPVECMDTNVSCSTAIQAGLLFRTQSVHRQPNKGTHYYVNIHEESNQIRLNEINNSFDKLHYENVTIDFNTDYTVRLEAISDEFRVYLDNRYKFSYYHSGYTSGSIGLGVGGTVAIFKKLQIMFSDNNKLISMNPSKYPTKQPSNQPTKAPTDNTNDPTNNPTKHPTKYPIQYITSSLQMSSESNVIQKRSSLNTTQQIIIISVSIICLSLCIFVIFMYRKRGTVKDDNDNNNVNPLRNDGNMVNMVMFDEELKEWLTRIVKLPQYFEIFVANGYDNIDSIKTINNKSQLETIGIKPVGHKTRIIAKIKELRQENIYKCNAYIRQRDIVDEMGITSDGSQNEDIDLMVVKFWLKSDVELPQYYDNFIQNTYNRLELIADINNVLQLNEIGITEENHCMKMLKAIELLRLQNEDTEDEQEGDITVADETDGFMMEDVSDDDGDPIKADGVNKQSKITIQ